MIFVLLAANILIFLTMTAQTGAMSWNARTLFDWGGNLGLASLHGQPWRIVTATFLHASLSHIFGNMVLLLITGSFLERKLGSVRFVLVYLACGIAGGVLSAWSHPNVVGVGASGAIAGLLGAMIALYATRRAPEVSGAWIAQTFVINALYSFAPNVDWLAHLGGFLAGLGLGALLATRMPAMEARALPDRTESSGRE